MLSSVVNTDGENSSSICLPCQLRRSSPELSFYIIDPIPQFSEEHKNLVVEYWHFVTDHISQVDKKLQLLSFALNFIQFTTHYFGKCTLVYSSFIFTYMIVVSFDFLNVFNDPLI